MKSSRWKLTTTQIGAIGEDIVASGLMIASGGRLSPFQPVADDDGIDLLIYVKKTGKALPIQVKSRLSAIKKPGKSERGNTVHFEIRAVSVRSERHAYLLAILLTKNLRNIERAWLIPMSDIADTLNKKRTQNKYIMRANKSLDTNDKYKQYQLKNLQAVSEKLGAIFEKGT